MSKLGLYINFIPLALLPLLHFEFINNKIFCLLIFMIMILNLIKEFFQPDVSLCVALTYCLIGSVISSTPFLSPTKAFEGFSNQGVITIASLLVIAKAIYNTGFLNVLCKKLLDGSTSLKIILLKLSIPLIALSSFFNNTPIVAIFMPQLREWGVKKGISPSKLLMPLAFFTTFGGICTLIGTSTNILLDGMAKANGLKGISMFELTYIGVPCAIAGSFYLILIGSKILPNNKDLLETTPENMKNYLVEMVVLPNSSLVNKTILDAGLRELEDLFLFEVQRELKVHAPVKSDFILKEHDKLIFSGPKDKIIELNKFDGLDIQHNHPELTLGEASLQEVIIGPSSPLIDKSIDEVWFNKSFNASVLGFHRNGENLTSGYAQLPLKMGDTLILLAGKGFRKIWQNSNFFMLVSPLREDMFKTKNKFQTIMIFCLFILAVLFDLAPLSIIAFSTAILLTATNIIQSNNLYRIIDWNILITIAASFGLSNAFINSGAAAELANLILILSSNHNHLLVLAAVFILTNILTETMTNNAAAAIIFPIALTTSQKIGLDFQPFLICITIAASCSFATPIGYQTNMLVYGPGGYKFKDYIKVGLPISILFFCIAMIIIPWHWPFIKPV